MEPTEIPTLLILDAINRGKRNPERSIKSKTAAAGMLMKAR
jgi:hypothetical protein